MDDLTAKVQEILGSEEGMNQLRELAGMLGIPEENSASGSSPDLGAMLSGLNRGSGQPEEPALSAASLAKIGSLFRNMQRETPSTAFLRALRPLLHTDRQKKVDEAVRLMQLVSLLPVLQQSGLLSALTGGQAESR